MYLYLGEPDFEDVESAARLLNRYRESGGLTPEGAQMFLMMCKDWYAVLRRAAELRGDPPPPPPTVLAK